MIAPGLTPCCRVRDHPGPPARLISRATAELVGTAFLVATVIGSGIAAQTLSPHDLGLQLLGTVW